MTKRYAIKNIFRTLQGEGFHSGTPAVFVRFAGCNLWSGRAETRERDAGLSTLGCSRWCDTDFVGGERLEAAEVVARAKDVGGRIRFMVLTGGEPMLQLDRELALALSDAGYYLALETNGTREVPTGLVDWITVSPKCFDERWVQRGGNELKLVYPAGADPEAFRQASVGGFDWLYLQPEDGPKKDANTACCVAYALAHPHWRLSFQTHKALGIE